jgi:glucokinase
MIGCQLLIGKHFQADCLAGHLPVTVGGKQCTCGNLGCAEAEAAEWSLQNLCRNWTDFGSSSLAQGEINFETLFRRADAGDAEATGVRDYYLKVWTTNAVALIHAYDPELLLDSGGAMRDGDRIVAYVQDYVARHAWTPWDNVQVRIASLGNDAVLLGAVPLISGLERSQANVR